LYLIVFAIVALFGAFLHVIVSKGNTAPRVIEIVLLYWFGIAIGASGIFAYVGHTFRANQVAASIGWPEGNPFQEEVAAADLAWGVLGLACIAIRENFWTATAVAAAVMYWGDAFVHVNQLVRYGNHHADNAGPILWGCLVIPAVAIGLLIIHSKFARTTRASSDIAVSK
jgi:hypothetical protein